MWMREPSIAFRRFLQSRSNLALCFFFASTGALMLGFGGAWLAIDASVNVPQGPGIQFPAAFGVSTLLLMIGSATLQNASRHIRCERQRMFRRRMFQSLVIGISFVMFQTQGLWFLLRQQESGQTIGLSGGAFAFILMHGVHFMVALLFVVFVLLQGLAGRYDHEYSWGVTFCAWFWHFLGIVWLMIIGCFLLAAAAPV